MGFDGSVQAFRPMACKPRGLIEDNYARSPCKYLWKLPRAGIAFPGRSGRALRFPLCKYLYFGIRPDPCPRLCRFAVDLDLPLS